jgi:hypothetical protein
MAVRPLGKKGILSIAFHRGSGEMERIKWVRLLAGECEGVRKRTLLTASAAKPSGKKNRFPGGDVNRK